MIRKSTAIWTGSGKEGQGKLTTQSKTLNDVPYNFRMRFEDAPGTNPEELIAAAHAGCFNMKLSFVLGNSGFTPEMLHTTAGVTLHEGSITGIHLDLKAKIAGITKEQFATAAEDAKLNCPVSQALSAVPLTLSIELQ